MARAGPRTPARTAPRLRHVRRAAMAGRGRAARWRERGRAAAPRTSASCASAAASRSSSTPPSRSLTASPSRSSPVPRRGGVGSRGRALGLGLGPADAFSPTAPLVTAAPARPGDLHEGESALTEVRRARAPRGAVAAPPGPPVMMFLACRKPSWRTGRMACPGGSSRQPGTAAATLPSGPAQLGVLASPSGQLEPALWQRLRKFPLLGEGNVTLNSSCDTLELPLQSPRGPRAPCQFEHRTAQFLWHCSSAAGQYKPDRAPKTRVALVSCFPFCLTQPQVLVWWLSCLPSVFSTHLSNILSKNDVNRKRQQFHADRRGLGWWHDGKPQPETEGKWVTSW